MAVNWADFEPVEKADAPAGKVDWSQFEPVDPSKEPGDTKRGFKVAFEQLPQLGYGLAAITASAIESAAGEGGLATSAKNWAVKGYQDWGQKIQSEAQDTDEFDVSFDRAKEGDFGALVDWLQYGVGYSVGQGLQILGTAGVGAAVGKFALRPAVEKLASGLVAKEVERLTASGVAREIAEKQAVGTVAAQAGALGATGAQAFGMEGGEIGGDLAERSVAEGRVLTGTELARAAGATTLAGLYEFAGDALGLGAMLGKVPMGKKIGEMAGLGGRAARGAVAGLAVAPAEGLTEYLQTGVEEYGKGTEENLLPSNQSPENQRQALNAAALGAIGGAVMGAGGGVVTGPREAAEEQKTARAVETVIAAPDVDTAIAVAAKAAAEPVFESDVSESITGGLIGQGMGKAVDLAVEDATREAGYSDMERQRAENIAQATARADMAHRRFAEQDAQAGEQARAERVQPEMEKLAQADVEDRAKRIAKQIQDLDAKGLTSTTAQAYRAGLVKRLDELGFEAPVEPALDTPQQPLAPKTVAGAPVDAHSDAGLQALAVDPATPATTRHAAAQALAARIPDRESSTPSNPQPGGEAVPKSGTIVPNFGTAESLVNTGVLTPPEPAPTNPDKNPDKVAGSPQPAPPGIKDAASQEAAKPVAEPIQAGPTEPAVKQGGEYRSISSFGDLALRASKDDVNVQAASAYADKPFSISEGVKRVPIADIEMQSDELFSSPDKRARVAALASKIIGNLQIEPLLLARRSNGRLYVAEGNHRARALQDLGYDAVPALIAEPAPTKELPAQKRERIAAEKVAQLTDAEQAIVEDVVADAETQIDAEAFAAKPEAEQEAELDQVLGEQSRETQTENESVAVPADAATPEAGSTGGETPVAGEPEAAPVAEGAGEPAAVDRAAAVAAWDEGVADAEKEHEGNAGARALWGYHRMFHAVDKDASASGVADFVRLESKVEPKTFDEAITVLDEYLKVRAAQVAKRSKDDVQRYQPGNERGYRQRAGAFEDAAKKVAGGYDKILRVSEVVNPNSDGAKVMREAIAAKEAEFRAEAASSNETAELYVADDQAATDAKFKPFDPAPRRLQKSVLGLSPKAKGSNFGWFMARMGMKDWYTDGHVVTDRPPVKNVRDIFGARQKSERKDRPDLDRIFSQIPKSEPIEIIPLADWTEDRSGVPNIVLFDAAGKVTGISRPYYDLMRSIYPNSRFVVREGYDGNSVVEVMVGNKLVAGVMPMRTSVDRSVEEVRATMARNVEKATEKTEQEVPAVAEVAPVEAQPAEQPAAPAPAEPKPASAMTAADHLRAAAAKMDEAVSPAAEKAPAAEISGEETEQKGGTRNEDVGENLWYNRRNFTGKATTWDDVKGLNDTLKVKEVVKSKVWPKPDYEQLVEDGMQPFFARLLKQVYDGIAVNPAGTTDADLQKYIAVVNKVREAVFDWAKDNNANRAFLESAMDMMKPGGGPVSITSMYGKPEFTQAVLKRIWPESFVDGRYRINEEAKADLRAIGGNRPYRAMQFDVESMRDAVTDLQKGWPKSQEQWQRQGIQVLDRAKALTVRKQDQPGGKDAVWVIEINGRYSTSSRKEVTAADAYPPEAKWLVVDKRRDVVATAETEEAAKEKARELTKREAKGGDIRGMNISQAEREGPARREEGENISSERLKDAFGFRGVNFGREGWINQAERQAYLNHAHDALYDLAEIIGVPPKALSLNGLLGIAFGAQGRGGHAAAHFVPGVNEINLTKTMGAGTLAHEWGHALDHYFATQGGLAKDGDPWMSVHGTLEPTRMVRDGMGFAKANRFGELRPEIVAAFKTVVETMERRPMTEAEVAAQRQMANKRTMDQLEKWIQHFRKDVERNAPDDLAKFDKQAERLRKGERGSGLVKVGGQVLSEPVARIKGLVKNMQGQSTNIPSNWKGLESNASHVAYVLEQKDAAKEHVPQTTSTQYAGESSAKDRGKGGKAYWRTRWEMFARAFETYVADKLAEKAQNNTFLSDAALRAEAKDREGGFAMPYPRGEDRTRINDAIGKLVNEIETRETDKGVAMFQRGAGEAGSSPALIQQAVDRITARWGNAPQVVVVDSMQDERVPESVRKADAKQRSQGASGEPEGFFHEGKVYLVASAIKETDVPRVLFHEALGHGGLRGVFGERLNPILDDVARAMPGRVKEKAAQYGLDFKNLEDRRQASEEVLAVLAQTMPRAGLVKRAIAAIRQFLREIGFDLKLSDNDILANFIIPARGYVERGGQELAAESAPAFGRGTIHEGGKDGFWQKLRAGWKGGRHDAGRSGLGLDARAAAYASRDRGGLRAAEIVFDASDRGGQEILRWAGEIAGFQDYYTVGQWTDGNLDLYVVPVDLAAGSTMEDLRDGRNLRDWAILKYTLTKIEGENNYTFGVSDPATNTAALKALQERGKIKPTGDLPYGGGDQYQRVELKRGESKLFMNELARRFGMSEGHAPNVYVPYRDTGANPKRQRDYSAAEIEARFSRSGDAVSAVMQSPKVAGFLSGLMKSPAAFGVLKPFQTQYHKAEMLARKGMPQFKAVFDRLNTYLTDISAIAVKAEQQAPAIFRELTGIGPKSMREAFKGAASEKDVQAIGPWLTRGTLYGGGSPLEGVRWTKDELMGKRAPNGRVLPAIQPLTEYQAELYKQARAAIDQSLEDNAKAILHRHVAKLGVTFDRDMGLADVAETIREQLKELVTDLDVGIDAATTRADEAHAEHEAAKEKFADTKSRTDRVTVDNAKKRLDMEEKTLDNLKAERVNITNLLGDSTAEAARKYKAGEEPVEGIVNQVEKKAKGLIDHGYMPLSRFGNRTVTAKDADGKVQFFGTYDGTPLVPGSANREMYAAAKAIKEANPDWTVTPGIKAEQAWKMYQGLSLEALENFMDFLDPETKAELQRDAVIQEYLSNAVNNRSVLKRLIHRQGTPGFSTDVPRILAAFVTSNARNASGLYNLGEAKRLVNDIPKEQGDVADEAANLVEYVTKPGEEAAMLRGFLFFHFLGGSVAAAAVNLTQTPMVTAPYLTQHASVADVASAIASAAKQAVKDPASIEGPIGEALQKAEKEGVTAPQQIYHLTATAANNPFSSNRQFRTFMTLWGGMFGAAEVFNRRVAFIAAYEIANKNDIHGAAAYAFANKAVTETQFIYSKVNRPNLGRGALGATVMTFKIFSISWLELLRRLPPKQQLMMLGMMLLIAGAEGLPFEEDISDGVDTLGQWLGFTTNTKKWTGRVVKDVVGEDLARPILKGLGGMLPLDLHSRLGMANLLPATAFLKQSEIDKTRDVAEAVGPVGSVLKAFTDSLQLLARGKWDKAAVGVSPKAVRDAYNGVHMAVTGESQDTKGRLAMRDVTALEGIGKMTGFNPQRAATEGEAKREIMLDRNLRIVRMDEIASDWADGILQKDTDKTQAARDRLRRWNEDNPEMRINATQVMRSVQERVRAARRTSAERFLKSTPKAMRQDAREAFNQ